jgi:NCS1 family nucleobase:cation symporter-1
LLFGHLPHAVRSCVQTRHERPMRILTEVKTVDYLHPTGRGENMAAVFQVERRALEPISPDLRHGSVRRVGVLWAAANLGLPPWALGVLAIGLGLSAQAAIASVVIGNVIGAVLLAIVSALGPAHGKPAIVLTEPLLGRWGNRLPAILNAVSCLGWYAVNAVLGAQALAALLGTSFLAALVLITLVLLVVAFVGHELVHTVEAVAGAALVVLFLIMAGRFLTSRVPVSHVPPFSGGMFLLSIAIVASYLFSWAPYATDYSRYLPESTPRSRVFWATLWGAWGATTGVELLGVLAALLAGTNGSPTDVLVRAMGPLAAPALVAVVLGTVTANALNAYTGTLSSLAFGLRVSRPVMALVFGILGGVLSYVGAHGFSTNYENFLLLLSYWVAPWIGILAAATYLPPRMTRELASSEQGRLLILFIFAILAAIPFMDQTLFEGPVARLLGGGDIGYWIGLVVAFLVARSWLMGRSHALSA